MVIPVDLMPHEVELLAAAEQTDTYGTPVMVPAESGVTSRAYMQPRTSSEGHSSDRHPQGQRVVDGGVCYLPPTVDLTAWAYLRWRGVLFEIDGSPFTYDTPAEPVGHHTRASVRRVR